MNKIGTYIRVHDDHAKCRSFGNDDKCTRSYIMYIHYIICVDCSRLKGKCPTEKLREQLYTTTIV